MPSPEELHARALDLLVKGETAGGITDLKEYLAAEPEDEAAWLELATAYTTVQHGPDALRCFATAVELDGSVVDARLGYARALARGGKLDDAAFQLLQASKIDPGDARVLYELGVVFYDKRLYDKAIAWLTKAATAAPADARASYALGLALEAKKDIGGAVAAYREAVRRDPTFLDAKRTLADALASMGEHEQAIAVLEALLRVERSNEQAAHNLDVLHRALADMRDKKLLGKTERELELSALVQEGQLERKGRIPTETLAAALGDDAALGGAGGLGGWEVVRWAAPLADLWAGFEAAPPGGAIRALMLVLTHPERAAQTKDEVFRVTVVAEDGKREEVDYATAITLTFLREALGCPMTHAGSLYARLLAGEASVEWGGSVIRFASAPRPDKPNETRHGILATPKR